MNPTITLPEGILHGTPQGHEAGCKGDRVDCPALYDHGMTCTSAYVQSTTTPARYFKARTRDPRPERIAFMLGYRPRARRANLNPRARGPWTPEREAQKQAQLQAAQQRAEIRAWANASGFECSHRGYIPRHIMDAYNTHHESGSAQ